MFRPVDEFAGREDVYAGNFQLGRYDRTFIRWSVYAADMLGHHVPLLEQRCDQTVTDSAVLGALTNRIDSL
ncbi:hypothetical protein D3C81_1930540 [compost metagenome]